MDARATPPVLLGPRELSLAHTAHAPGGKPFVTNLQRKHYVSLTTKWGWFCQTEYDTVGDPPVPYPWEHCWSVPDPAQQQAVFKVSSAVPRHASALYLAANAAGFRDSVGVASIMVDFLTPSGDTVRFGYTLMHRRDLRNWWAEEDTANPLPVAPLDSNPDWHQLDRGDGYRMSAVYPFLIPCPGRMLVPGPLMTRPGQ